MLRATRAGVVLGSDWRRDRALDHLRHELAAAGVECTLIGTTPELGAVARWREIAAWMAEHDVEPASVAIIDDGFAMGPLAARFVRTSPLVGLDDEAARAILALFAIAPRAGG